jgi:hypothetical protein
MATLITHDGLERTVIPSNLKRGFTLEEMYFLLECDTIEVVTLADGRLMVIDENGKLLKRPVNNKATELFLEDRDPLDYIVGPALVCDRRECQ